MHRVLSFIVAVGLLFAPSSVRAEEAPTFRFVRKEAAVGDTDAAESRIEMRLRFVIAGPEVEPEPVELSDSTTERYTVTVLAARKGLMERVKMAYGESYDESLEEGKMVRKPSPVSGKTYIAGLVKGRVVVTDEAGKPVSKEEQAAVKQSVPALGKVDPLEAALPDKPLRVGDSLERFAKVLTQEVLQQDDPTMRFRDTQVKLGEIRREDRGTVGIFRVSTMLTIQDPEAPIVMTVPMEGQFIALAEGAQVLEFSLAGPVQLAATPELRKQGLTVEGDGQMKLLVTTPPGK